MNTPEQGRIVVVGSINADLIARVRVHPAPGETVIGQSMTVLAGGKGANQAVAAARLGADVTMIGAVGTDSFAAQATTGLRGAGVDLAALDVIQGETGVAMITVADDGENAIVVIPGANASVDQRSVTRHESVIAEADVVVLQGEIPREGIEAAARVATGRVVLNLAPVVELDAAVLRLANPLVVNEHEARGALALLGQEASIGDEHAEVARALVASGVRSVVVTLGANGALVATRPDGAEGEIDVSAVPSPRVRAVDTTGAGDAFVGAMAYRLAAGDTLDQAAHLAVRVGAYAVTGHGAQASYPSASATLPEIP